MSKSQTTFHPTPGHTSSVPSKVIVEGFVALGDVSSLDDYLANIAIEDPTMHHTLATLGLLAWNEAPLQYAITTRMLSTLMKNGANAQARTLRGDTVAERLGRRLGTIEGNEDRGLSRHEIDKAGPTGDVLRACWMIMDRCGVDLSEAMRVRNIAMEPGH